MNDLFPITDEFKKEYSVSDSDFDRYITPLIDNIDLSIINSNILLDYLNNNSAGKLKIILEFIVFLIRKNIVTDKNLLPLVKYFEYTKNVRKDVIPKLLRVPYYDYFEKKDWLQTEYGYSLLFALADCFRKVCFADEEIKIACHQIMERIAKNELLASITRAHLLRNLNSLAEKYLFCLQGPLTNKTAITVLSKINNSDDNNSYGYIFLQVLQEMVDAKSICDPDMVYLFNEIYPNLVDNEQGHNSYYKRNLNSIIDILISGCVMKYKILNPKHYSHKTLVCININQPDIAEFWEKFLIDNFDGKESYKLVSRYFANSIDHEDVHSLSDLSFDIFRKQILFFSKFESKVKFPYPPLINFYLYIWKYFNNTLFAENGITGQILLRNDIAAIITENYSVLPYSILDPVPQDDKWMLCISGREETNSDHAINGYVAIDFSKIEYEGYRALCKSYLWMGSGSFSSRYSGLGIIVQFLNYLSKLKIEGGIATYNNNSFHIFKTDNLFELSLYEVLQYRNYIFLENKSAVIRKEIFTRVKMFLSYVASRNMLNCCKYNDILVTRASTKKNANAISKAEARQLFRTMFQQNETYESKLFFLLISLIYNSDLRITEALGLTVDAVETVGSSYMIKTQRKQRSGDPLVIPATEKMKRIINDILELTKPLREECHDNKKTKMLFLTRDSKKKGQYKTLSREACNKYLTRMCELAGVQRCTCSNIRDTYMTEAFDYVSSHGYSEFEHTVLTGHTSSDTDARHYIDEAELNRALEASYHIFIGDLSGPNKERYKIKGTVVQRLPNDIAVEENEVEDALGFCKDADLESCVSCLVCEKFVTDISRKNEFKKAIEDVDIMISKTNIPHAKEDLNIRKTLLVAYLKEIMKLEHNYS